MVLLFIKVRYIIKSYKGPTFGNRKRCKNHVRNYVEIYKVTEIKRQYQIFSRSIFHLILYIIFYIEQITVNDPTHDPVYRQDPPN